MKRGQSLGRSAKAISVMLWVGIAAGGATAALAQTAPSAAPAGSMPYMFKTWLSALHAPQPASLALQGIGATVPGTEYDLDAYGLLGTYLPGGAVTTATNPFFQSLGTNGRSCATCHQPSSSMSISLPDIVARYLLNGAKDPLFAPVDGANCPNLVPAANTKKSILGGNLGKGKSLAAAYSLILTRGTIRIFLPVPANAEYTIKVMSDPTTCNTDPTYDSVTDTSTTPATTAQMISVFRRPIMSSNLIFKTSTLAGGTTPPGPPFFGLDPITGLGLPVDQDDPSVYDGGNIMWDGREGNLRSQATDATMGHAQFVGTPDPNVMKQIVAFEQGVFSAQSSRLMSGSLSANGQTGGPVPLAAAYTPSIGAIGPGPKFNLYDSLATVTGTTLSTQQQESINRGQVLFNGGANGTRLFTISNVAGLNNLGAIGNPFPFGSCATCHNSENNGADAAPQAQHAIGVAGDSPGFGGNAPAKDLPVFQITCNNDASSVYSGTVVYTNDPGKALITGKCADIASFTVPQLRGLAARRPYFHDGSAQSLMDVVNFYNKRFAIGFTAQEKADLVNFLASL